MEVAIFTKKCPPKEVEVGYFGSCDGKNPEIPIKTALFRLKISYDQWVVVWWLKVTISHFLHECLIALAKTLPNFGWTGQ